VHYRSGDASSPLAKTARHNPNILSLWALGFLEDERIERIAYSPDGRFVVTDNGKLGLQVWDARDGRKHSADLGSVWRPAAREPAASRPEA
jgi:hypothetical protein